ncbi:glycerol-3-phosphate transporter ATP-binding subunit [compost metagenome]
MKIEGAEFVLSPDAAAGLKGYNGKEIILGIRPEHIYGDDFAPGVSTEHQMQAHIKVVEHLGSENLVYFTIGRRTVTAKVHPETKAYSSLNKQFIFDLSKARYFDPATEDRIVW